MSLLRRRPRSARRPRLLLLLPLATLALTLASCMDILNTLVDNPAPTGLRASDGDYADRVEVSWGQPSLTSDRWKDFTVDHYDLSWSGATWGSIQVTGTSHSIPILPAERATELNVTVTSVLKAADGTMQDGGSVSDAGFALLTADLLWPDGGGTWSFTGTDFWYVTMLEEGFTYRFDFAPGTSGHVEFLAFKTLSPRLETSATGNSISWTCDEGGTGSKFYVHVLPALADASFFASYGF